jgi:SAM-dependent methyltransferase
MRLPSTMNTGDIQRIWRDIDLGEQIHPYEMEMFPALLGLAKKSEKILEIGVGRGRMVRLLKKNDVKADFYFLDLITEYAKSILGFGVAGDSRSLPFESGVFDITYSLGVIEHFPETYQALKEHVRVTKSGGYVLISTPHLGPATLARYVVYQALLKRKHRVSFEVLLGRNLSLRQIRRDCEAVGLEILHLKASGPIIPSANPQWPKLYNLIPLPADRFGAYLWCLARKRSREYPSRIETGL